MNQKRGLIKSSVISMILMMVMLFAMSITVAAEAPTDVRQTGDSDTSVRVEWTGVAGAKYYGVEVATDPGFTNVVYKDYCYSSSQYAYVSSLAAGSSYYVRIGYGADRNSCYANWSVPIEVVTTPARVGTVKFVGAADASVTIAWDAAPGANLYYVEYNNQTYGVADTVATLPYEAGVNSAKVASARVSSAGYVADTLSSWVYDLSALTTKIAKNDLGFRNAWTAINIYQFTANYYGHGLEVKVYDAKSGKKKFSKSATYSSYGTSVEFSKKFKYNTAYKYRARAYVTTTDGQKIYGSWSAYRYFITPKKCTYTVSGKKIKLTWSKLSNISKIKVEVSTKEDSGYKTCATLSGKKTSYTITKYGKKALKKGKTYYFRVTYYTKSGKKQYKNDIISTGSAKIY